MTTAVAISGPTFLTMEQTAELLQVTEETALRWAREGRIPSRKLSGKIIRVPRAELEALLHNSEGASK